MSSDGEHFTFDTNANQHPLQGERHSPPALDELAISPHNRPPNLFLPRQGSVDFGRFERILKGTKDHETISKLKYHVREDVKESLNMKKQNRNDWRGVASRMDVKPSIIENIEKKHKEDPTGKLFEEISDKKTKQLIQVLYQMDRHDVLNIFYDEMCGKKSDMAVYEKREVYQKSPAKWPSQESTPVSGNSASEFLTPSGTPSKDTTTPNSAESGYSGMGSTCSPGSKKPGCIAKQHSDKQLVQSPKSAVDFHSTESTNFWKKIPPKPGSRTKEWREMEEKLKSDFSKESRQSQIMRFICYVLKIEPYEERHNKYVHEEDFANLVAWFGPIKSGKDGLFSKITQLMKYSVDYKENSGPHSFFAGYMTKDEADKVIGDQEQVGSFLIRFSSSFASNGSFAVCLKTENGPEHHLLEGNPETGKISFHGKDYDDLITLYRKGLCTGGVSENRRTSCTTTCPNLPLNAMFKPYGAGPRPPQGFGRGRGRGRGQEQ